MSSPHSSSTSNAADRAAPAELPIEISYASSDEEAIELHRFLCVISKDVLLAPIDAKDSMEGVLDVVRNGAAINARIDGHLVGALGIVKVHWWFNRSAAFMTDRWFFAYPQFHHRRVGAFLKAHGEMIAEAAGLKLIINGHMRQRSNGAVFTRPEVLGTGEKPELH